MSSLGELAQIAVKQKAKVLESEHGGYSPSLHSLFRVHLKELGVKYQKNDARDAIFLLLYLHAYVNGTESKDFYMWAFPTVKQIREDTGIHGDRIKPLCRLLEVEGLLITKKIPCSSDIIIGSNNTANPIRLQGAVTIDGNVEFRREVTGLNVGIGSVTGLQTQLDAIWAKLNNHTHDITLPTHNHGNSANQNWGGTFTTSRSA